METAVGSTTQPARLPATRQRSAGKRSVFSHPKETYIAVLAAAGILAHLILRYALGVRTVTGLFPLYLTLAVGGLPLVVDLLRKLAAREFGSDLLAGISILTAVLLGEHLVGAIVVLMLSGGAALEHYATRRASSVLDALAKRMPSAAHRKTEAGLANVGLEAVSVGDTLVVFPHEICPVDGLVVEGHSVMDESYLKGEPFEISKAPGSQVLSGAVNGDSALTIVAIRLAVDSRYARIMQVMLASQQNRPRLRRIGDQLGAWYTPLAVGVATFSWLWSGEPHRFLAVMVIATPCPLLIAIPVAVIGAISLSAQRSIIIKNPAVLEQIDTCRTFIFDKTGTLTYGKPTLTDVLCAPGFTRAEVLGAAASLEQYSKHPLADAIVSAARDSKVRLEPVSQISEKPGEGLFGIVAARRVLITGRSKVPSGQWALPPVAGGLECLVLIEGTYAALLRFHDTPRPESNHFVSHLRPRHLVHKVILLSGDRESEVRYLAEAVGIAEVQFGKSPEEKVEIVREETQRARTLFVGDGINDAPALMAATVGVAFGQNSDITAEAADAVILEASLRKVDEIIHIGRRMRSIALQSVLGGMGLSILGMLVAAVGYLPPVAGAVTQEVIDVLAVLNALRVALPFHDLTDF